MYRHEQDESTFQLVDTSRPQRPMYRCRPMGVSLLVILSCDIACLVVERYRRDRDRKDMKKGGRQPFQKKKTQ